MAWYPILGYLVFWIGLIVAIIIYAIKRKWYPVGYLVSVCLYIFTAGFIMDIFYDSIGKNGVLFILAFSALLMILVGFYISRKLVNNKK